MIKKRNAIKRAKVVRLFLAVSALTGILAGCGEMVIPNESDKQVEQYKAAGEEIINEYLKNHFKDAVLTSVFCETEHSDGYSYITDYVWGHFRIGEDTYIYQVNVDTLEVYTNYYAKAIGTRISDEIMMELGIASYCADNLFVGKSVPSTLNEELDSYDLNEKLDVGIPGHVNESNLDEFIAEILAGNGYTIHCSIRYNEEERIEDMDWKQISDNYQNVKLDVCHYMSGTDISQHHVLNRKEYLIWDVGENYKYNSYNTVEKDNIVLQYKEYFNEGDELVDIMVTDAIKPEDFEIQTLDTSIQIIMNKETEYYLCFYNMDFVGEKQLYYYLNTTKKYTEATIKEDSGYYYVAGYYGGLRPVYQSETFYIGEIPEK